MEYFKKKKDFSQWGTHKIVIKNCYCEYRNSLFSSVLTLLLALLVLLQYEKKKRFLRVFFWFNIVFLFFIFLISLFFFFFQCSYLHTYTEEMSAIRNKNTNNVIISNSSRQKGAQVPAFSRGHNMLSPRSAVFSGVPPPDLHTLNMQKNLEEYKIQVTELHDKLDACHNEIARLRASQIQIQVPDPPDCSLNSNVFEEHLEFMNDVENKMRNCATTIPTYNKTLQILCQELEVKLALQSQQLLQSNGDMDILRRKYNNLEQSIHQTPRIYDGLSLQPPRVLGQWQYEKSTKTVGSQTDFINQTLSVNTSVGDRSTPPSSPGNIHSQEIPIPTKELLDKLLLSLKVAGNLASVSYVKSIQVLLRKYSVDVMEDQIVSNPPVTRNSRSPHSWDRRRNSKPSISTAVLGTRRRSSPSSYTRSSTQQVRGSSPVLARIRIGSKSPSIS